MFVSCLRHARSHGEGGGATYLSPEMPFCREQLMQSQTICIILAPWVHAEES